MPLDWQHRVSFERRMQGRVFVTLSRLLGRAIVEGTLESLAGAAELAGGTDDDLRFAMQCQGVAGHLRALDITRPGILTPAFSESIRLEAERIAERNGRLAADLQRVALAAHEAGLRVVPLKGTCLRLTHYAADPSLRPSADLDLLIEPAEWATWTSLLRALGYTRHYGKPRHTEFVPPAHVPQDVDGDHPDHPRPIELHDHLSEDVFGRRFDITASYRAELVESRPTGLPLWLPSARTLSLHLVLHAAPSMIARGLRLAQLLDLRLLADDDDTVALLRRLGPVAWAAMTLAERRVPGLVPRRLRTAFDDLAPGPVRRAIVLRRPGVLRGDPERTGTLAGAALTGSPAHLVRRLAISLRSRAVHAARPDGGPSALRAIALFALGAIRRRGR